MIDKVKPDHKLQYIEVTDNIILTSLYPFEANRLMRYHESATMSCIALPDELFFVDCGAITSYAKKFRVDMEERFERPTTYLFLTHDRFHCCWGMEAFKDINVVMSSAGTSYYRKNLKEGRFATWKEYILRETPDDEKLRESLLEVSPFVPNIGVPKHKSFGLDSRVLFKVVGDHTRPYATVHDFSEKVLFIGDNLSSCYIPAIKKAWPISIIDAYIEWESMDIEYIIPGHGPVVDKSYISLIRGYLEDLLTKLREFKAQGLTKTQVRKHPDLPNYPGKKLATEDGGRKKQPKPVEDIIGWWYAHVLKEASEEDLMFIS